MVAVRGVRVPPSTAIPGTVLEYKREGPLVFTLLASSSVLQMMGYSPNSCVGTCTRVHGASLVCVKRMMSISLFRTT